MELGQFITLGMTLLALLARISHLVSKIDGVEKRQKMGMEHHFLSSGNDDLGQIVEASAPKVSAPYTCPIIALSNEPPKKKRKSLKKSKKSSIDDIFG